MADQLIIVAFALLDDETSGNLVLLGLIRQSKRLVGSYSYLPRFILLMFLSSLIKPIHIHTNLSAAKCTGRVIGHYSLLFRIRRGIKI